MSGAGDAFSGPPPEFRAIAGGVGCYRGDALEAIIEPKPDGWRVTFLVGNLGAGVAYGGHPRSILFSELSDAVARYRNFMPYTNEGTDDVG